MTAERRRAIIAVSALVVGLLVGALGGVMLAASPPAPTGVYLGYEGEHAIEDLVAAVRAAAHEVSAAGADRPVNVRAVRKVREHIAAVGIAIDDTAHVRLRDDPDDVAMTVLHEVAHVLTDDGHGPRWRETYLRAVEATLEPDVAADERARVEGHPDYQ